MKKAFIAILGLVLAAVLAIVFLDKKTPDRASDEENSDL